MRADSFFHKKRISARQMARIPGASLLLGGGSRKGRQPSRKLAWFETRYHIITSGGRVIRRRVSGFSRRLAVGGAVLALLLVVSGGALFVKSWTEMKEDKRRLADSAALLREAHRLTGGVLTERSLVKAQKLLKKHDSALADSKQRDQDLLLLTDRGSLIDAIERTRQSNRRAKIDYDSLQIKFTALKQKYQRVERLYETNLAESKFYRDARDRTESRVQNSEGRLAKMEDKVFLLMETLRGTLANDAMPEMEGDELSDITNLAEKIADQEEEHKQKLVLYAEYLDYAIAGMEKTILQTGLSFSHLKKAGYHRTEFSLALEDPRAGEESFGKGGPLEQKQAEDSEDEAKDTSRLRLAALDTKFEQFNILRDVIACMPLADPMKGEGRFVSGYGMRKDPFTEEPAMHFGIDVSAWYGTPIHSSGPGTVKFTGRRTAYGRVVEVDHGCGFMTRYAHLQEKKVKIGQKVEIGTLIGLVGNSGRSTGPHLHYEIRFKDNPLNPSSFMKGIKHVF